MKMMNGNIRRRGKGIQILAWNHGNSELQNSFHEIEETVEKYKPEVFGLYESNLKKDLMAQKKQRKLIIPYVDLTTHSFQATELCSYLQ